MLNKTLHCKFILTMKYWNDKTPAPNSYKKLAVQYSADTFVVNQTLVFRIKFCGENRQLLVAAKRYKQA